MNKIDKYETGEYGYLNNFLKNCQYYYIVSQKCDIRIRMQICNEKIMMTNVVSYV